MAGMSSDLEILKDIPGYKAILKSVLKSQIQLLIEQLSDHTGEETIILTASVHDGTLSHLGSNTGKGFLDGRDEIKSQFLAFCLKSHHRRKSTEARLSPYQRPQSGGPADRLTSSQGLSHKRPRLQPVSLQRAVGGDSSGNSFTPPDIHRAPSQNFSTNGQDSSSGVNVKLETSEQGGNSTDNTNLVAGSVSFPTSLQLSHTQTSAEQGTSDTNENQNDDDFTEQNSENEDSTAASIKIEPITESEMELEITGVEPGKTSVSADTWGQGQVLGTSGVGEGASNETGDQGGYKEKPQQYQPVQLIPYPPTSSREPVIFLQPITDQDQPITTPTDVKLTPTHDLASQASFTTMLTSFDFGTTQNVMTSDTVQDTPAAQNNQSKCSTFPQNMPKPSSSTFGTPPTFGPTPIPLSGNERIVIPSCADEQYLPFTKENYGKEKDKWVLKRHICQYCGKRCMKPSDLTRHIKIHTGEYPFECPSCKKRFREKFNLNAHFKKGSCTP